MKKLFSSCVLALATMGSLTASSFGSAFGLFPCCGCNCRCGCDFCVRQYNAFSPVCSGRIYCDGCMPMANNCGPACGPGPYGAPAGGMCPGGMCPGGLGYSGTLVGSADGMNAPYSAPLATATPEMAGKLAPLPAPPLSNPLGLPQNSNQFVAPSPLPAGPSSQLAPYSAIQNTGYYPSTGYYPPAYPAYHYNYYNYGYYNPTMPQPQPMVAPSYWSK
jgi:hypothetical protein